MFAGHAALALFAKAKRPSIPIALLVPIAFAPDWVEWIFDAFGHANRELSHSLVSVGIGSTLVGIIYWLVTRARTDAIVVWLTYVSHWPADFITGTKPTWPGGPMVGLELYSHTLADAVVESVLIVGCWWVYRRSLPVVARSRTIAALVPLGLIGMQILFDALQSPARY